MCIPPASLARAGARRFTSHPPQFSCQTAIRAPRPQRNEYRSVFAAGQAPGDNRARTGNLRRAKAALSQLSYVPVARTSRPEPARPAGPIAAVGLARIELATSRLSGVRSNHLSYRPAEATGGDARLRLGSLQRKPRKRNAKAADTCRTDLE